MAWHPDQPKRGYCGRPSERPKSFTEMDADELRERLYTGAANFAEDELPVPINRYNSTSALFSPAKTPSQLEKC
ncbi:hypothetical protein O9992_17635 [Vibrio lentus]|nr:hypothetical protein [Vibrio lentus]